VYILTLNLLTTTIVAHPSNASKWQMGFNSVFKGLNRVWGRALIYLAWQTVVVAVGNAASGRWVINCLNSATRHLLNAVCVMQQQHAVDGLI